MLNEIEHRNAAIEKSELVQSLPIAPSHKQCIGAQAVDRLNDVVERWVREDPGQWMWFHKRWKLTHANRRRVRKAA